MLIRPATDVVAHALFFTCPSLLTAAPAAIVPAATSLIMTRGGAAAALDLGRTKLRLEWLHQYGVMTSLLMNAALLALFRYTQETR
jgi:P pilus assembly chaperone PapD